MRENHSISSCVVHDMNKNTKNINTILINIRLKTNVLLLRIFVILVVRRKNNLKLLMNATYYVCITIRILNIKYSKIKLGRRS